MDQFQPPAPLSPDQEIQNALGGVTPSKTDPAFQPPRDRLKDLPQTAGVIYRDIPIVTVGMAWDPPTVRASLAALVTGLFDTPAQLIDSMLGDSRVASALASRTGGLLGRPVDFIAADDSEEAKECRDAFVAAWPRMCAEPVLADLQTWNVMLGWGAAQIVWDTTGDYAIPIPRPWHPRYSYYHWIYRCYVAVTQDGQTAITGGDGHWILHASAGEYRGWMHGAVRAIAPWWLARNYALRDFARWSERNGMPILKALTPSSADPTMVLQFRNSLQNLGQETCVQLPQALGDRDGQNFDVQWLESNNSAFEGFLQLIGACDREITLSLLAQILTTDVGPEGRGSYAAARVHADVRQALLEADARALEGTIHGQLARPFAMMNFGRAELAPRVRWNVKPYEDDKTAADTFGVLAQALVSMKNAGLAHEDPAAVEALFKSFGLNVGRLRIVEAMTGAGGAGAAASFGKPPGKPPAASARFAALVAENARLRIAMGATEEQLAAENEQIAAMLAEQEATAPRARRVPRRAR